MRKTLLLAGVACLFAAQAEAFDFNPYVSAKLKYSMMDNSWKATEVDDTDWGAFEESYDLKNADDKVFGGSIALGMKTPLAHGALRTEVEYTRNGNAKKSRSYREESDDYEYSEKFDIKLKSQALLFNAYYDFDTQTAFTPYIGFGLGFARLKGTMSYNYEDAYEETNISGSKNRTNFAWQIGAGIAYDISKNVAIDLGYRYMDYGKLSTNWHKEYEWGDMNITSKVESKAHEIILALRYTF